jgi:dolichol-phosphate mannosyltransferase
VSRFGLSLRIPCVGAFLRFNVVGLVGIVVQLAAVWLLTAAGLGYLWASSTAVLLAIAHNFGWHWRWTWADRATGASMWQVFGRFCLANGAVSLLSTVALMPLLSGAGGLPPVPANLIVIMLAGLLNFGMADRIAFRAAAPAPVSSKDANGCRAPHGA